RAGMVIGADQQPLPGGGRGLVRHAAPVEQLAPLVAVEPAGDVQDRQIDLLELAGERELAPVVVESVVLEPLAPDGVRAPERALAGRQPLDEAAVGAAHHADLAAAPGLLADPDNRVVAVARLVDERLPVAVAVAAAAHVLADEGVAVAGEVGGDLDPSLGGIV